MIYVKLYINKFLFCQKLKIKLNFQHFSPLDFVQEKKKNEDKNNGISKDE